MYHVAYKTIKNREILFISTSVGEPNVVDALVKYLQVNEERIVFNNLNPWFICLD